jgi:hypothetical protein
MIDLGPIQFDDTIVLRQLRNDLRDDWFPDPLGYDDMFGNDRIKMVLEQNLQDNDGTYVASPRLLLNVPKPNFTLRCALETGIADRALYHALANQLVPYFDPLLPWSVFSHRLAAENQRERYLFKLGTESWKDFIGVVRESLATRPILLSTDLVNYFDNIDLRILKRAMLDNVPIIHGTGGEKAKVRNLIETLFGCLRQWSFSEEHGLPQNRDASSFLANMYMLPVDKAMTAEGLSYYRYMDDIKITCQSEFEARKALKSLSLALRGLKLAVNSKKTVICRVDDKRTIDECLQSGGNDLQQLDSIFKTRAVGPISRALPLLRERTERLLDSGDGTNQRTFRFYLRRLTMIAACPEFSVPPEFLATTTERVVQSLSAAPSATDELVKYLRVVPMSTAQLLEIESLIRDPNRNFYTWQIYRLWQLLVQRQYHSPALLDWALAEVTAGPDGAGRSGATLYLGAMGANEERIEVAKNFKTVTSFIGQRAGLVAVQELPYSPWIEDFVKPFVRPDLQNVYRTLKNKKLYFLPPEPIPLSRIIDPEPDYE